jgi:autonomous glycyl radical cofactor GrcA
MFHARQTGNCQKFASFILLDQEKWTERCIKERSSDEKVSSIRSFEIKEISIDGGQAFLQVELQRDTYFVESELAEDGHKLPQGGYLANYQMKREGTTWYLNQPIDK